MRLLACYSTVRRFVTFVLRVPGGCLYLAIDVFEKLFLPNGNIRRAVTRCIMVNWVFISFCLTYFLQATPNNSDLLTLLLPIGCLFWHSLTGRNEETVGLTSSKATQKFALAAPLAGAPTDFSYGQKRDDFCWLMKLEGSHATFHPLTHRNNAKK